MEFITTAPTKLARRIRVRCPDTYDIGAWRILDSTLAEGHVCMDVWANKQLFIAFRLILVIGRVKHTDSHGRHTQADTLSLCIHAIATATNNSATRQNLQVYCGASGVSADAVDAALEEGLHSGLLFQPKGVCGAFVLSKKRAPE